jgi:cyanophycin synthetase
VVPEMLRAGLIEHGVAESAITIVETEEPANLAALEMARAGDLLLILADNVPRTWKQIIYFKPGAEVGAVTARPRSAEVPEEMLGAFELEADMELIRDERGVRIAREVDD